MDVTQVTKLLEPMNQWVSDNPFWTGLIVIVMYGFFFGKKKDYELEAKLFFEGDNKERGELEIKKYTKESMPILKLQLMKMDALLTGSVEIQLNGKKFVDLEISEDQRSFKVAHPVGVVDLKKQKLHVSPKWKTQTLVAPVGLSSQPKNHDKVSVIVGGKVFVGVFVVD